MAHMIAGRRAIQDLDLGYVAQAEKYERIHKKFKGIMNNNNYQAKLVQRATVDAVKKQLFVTAKARYDKVSKMR